MTEEKFIEGKRLLDKLNYLNKEKDSWERTVSIAELRLKCAQAGSVKVDASFINYDDLKLLVISKIERKIDEVRQLFDNL